MVSAADVQVFDLSEATPPLWRCTVIYGHTGKWKTSTACRMVKEKGLLISADDSWDVLLHPVNADVKDKIDVVVYEGLSQLEVIDYSGYDHIIIDPVSAVVDKFLDNLLENAKWANGFRERLMTDQAELKNKSTVAGIDYRFTRDTLRPIFDRLFDHPAHKVFTSHLNDPLIGLSKDPTLRPSIPNKTWEIIARQSNIIGMVEGGTKGEPTINVDETASYCVAKSRVAGIGGKMKLSDFIKAYKETM